MSFRPDRGESPAASGRQDAIRRAAVHYAATRTMSSTVPELAPVTTAIGVANEAFTNSVERLAAITADQMKRLEQTGTLERARRLVTAAQPASSRKGLVLVEPELFVGEYHMENGDRPAVPYLQFKRQDGNGYPLPAVPLQVEGEGDRAGMLVNAPGFTVADRYRAFAMIARRYYNVPQLGPDANSVANSRLPNVHLALLPYVARGGRDDTIERVRN